MHGSWFSSFGLGFAVILLTVPVAIAQTENGTAVTAAPDWAYTWDPDFKVPVADNVPQRLPGSTASFSMEQARDLFFAPNWHPENHPAMPEVVARGRKPDVRACGSCHRAEGTGGPESASLAGLPATYIAQQLADFKSGARKASGPNRAPVSIMLMSAKALTDEEVQVAANYFSSLKPQQIIKVVESDTVPKNYIERNFFVLSKSGGTEPLGQRIIEVPDDVEQYHLRDARTQFTAYVPVGSIAKGKDLVKTGGGGTTVPCAGCHGADLKGVGPIPQIAGRSPSYIVRQLYDFKYGARKGVSSAPMMATVERLSEKDMISLAAYVASLAP